MSTALLASVLQNEQLLYGELSKGKRSAGGPKKRYKDSLKVLVKSFGIPDSTWESLAMNHSAWRTGVSNGARDAEEGRLGGAEMKHAARNA